MTGWKTFANNEVLTASDVNNYLMRQSLIRVLTATERDAISLPHQGMTIFRDDLGREYRYFAAYNASTNPGGKVSGAGWYATDHKPVFIIRSGGTAQAAGSWSPIISGWAAAPAKIQEFDPSYDTDGWKASDGTLKILRAGTYRAAIAIQMNTTGTFAAGISVNSTTDATMAITGASTYGSTVSGLLILAKGDLIRGLMLGAGQTMSSTSGAGSMSLEFIGD